MSDKLRNYCQYCGSACIKAGKHKNGSQKIKCKNCQKYQLVNYSNAGCKKNVKENMLKIYLKNVGIRGVALLLGVSVNTVIKEIKKYKDYRPLISFRQNQVYEIDEMRTYVKNKKRLRWIAYAIERSTKKVINVVVGSRSNSTLEKVVNSVLALHPKRIFRRCSI
jgi:transposase-like protein